MADGAPPELNASHMTCPHCGVDANQRWHDARIPAGAGSSAAPDQRLRRADCVTCNQSSYWIEEDQVWPVPRAAIAPVEGMPSHLEELYDEARSVFPHSPRAAAGLLRLLIEQHVKQLTPTASSGAKLAERIQSLQADGMITVPTFHMLDAVRVAGNEAVHDGVIRAEGDDAATVMDLFRLVNRLTAEAVEDAELATRILGPKKREPTMGGRTTAEQNGA